MSHSDNNIIIGVKCPHYGLPRSLPHKSQGSLGPCTCPASEHVAVPGADRKAHRGAWLGHPWPERGLRDLGLPLCDQKGGLGSCMSHRVLMGPGQVLLLQETLWLVTSFQAERARGSWDKSQRSGTRSYDQKGEWPLGPKMPQVRVSVTRPWCSQQGEPLRDRRMGGQRAGRNKGWPGCRPQKRACHRGWCPFPL